MSTVTFLDEHRPRLSFAKRAEPQARPSLFARLAIEWQRRKSERMLESLPQEIRKDIGWPATIDK